MKIKYRKKTLYNKKIMSVDEHYAKYDWNVFQMQVFNAAPAPRRFISVGYISLDGHPEHQRWYTRALKSMQRWQRDRWKIRTAGFDYVKAEQARLARIAKARANPPYRSRELIVQPSFLHISPLPIYSPVKLYKE